MALAAQHLCTVAVSVSQFAVAYGAPSQSLTLVACRDSVDVNRRRRNGYNRKRYSSFMLMAMLMKGGLLAIAYKGVAILAAKALLVAKIALVISTLVALKKLVAGGGDEKVTYEIVKTPHVSHAFAHSGGYDHPGHYDRSTGGSGPYRRSVDLPYHAYQPIPLQQQDGAAAAA
ncbi:uncharacterized protein LOC126176148 [Schistocerca cancellata]|uniref:uncharacterized protein LOC126176148 n=1 Tax=Schistocerca cancellata TaxID=274614 RepID=UPI0021182CCB|nr:uncharacterized protein LOC126176148 [Schistocerca cancellata]